MVSNIQGLKTVFRRNAGQFLKMKSGGGGSLPCIFQPKTQNQKLYYDYLKNKDVNIVVCSGPAGSGKTALACHYAIDKYKQGVFKKIIITRPLVTVEEDIGFLPGTLNKKMEPWTRPMMDIFNEYYPMTVLNNMIKEGIIEISPLAFMRGRTFKHAIIIADEMQNSSPNQMLMVTTRIGEDSKLIITGDLKQTDTAESGLKDLLYRYRTFSPSVANITNHVKLVEMGNEDIVRHHVVSKILDLYSATTAAAKPPQTPEMKDTIKTMLDSPGMVEVAAVVESFKSIPDFSAGGGNCDDSSMDCALIPKKDVKVIKKYIKTGVTDGIFDEACFLESINVNYTSNSTDIRKR